MKLSAGSVRLLLSTVPLSAVLLSAVLLSAGCAARPGPVFEPAAGAGGPRWPAPPEVERLAWSGEYRAARGPGFVRPHGVGLGAGGQVCVADPGARAVWVHAEDRPLRLVGRGVLVSPIDCAFLPDASVAVTDSAGRAVVAFDTRGRVLWRSAAGELARPAGLAVDDAAGRLLIADAKAHDLVEMSFEGRVTGRLGGRGREPGRFNFPTAVAVGPGGTIYVADSLNFRVQVLSHAGQPRLEFGVAGDGPGTFLRPRGLGVDGEGRIYVADALFDNVQIFDREGRLLLVLGGRGRRPGEFSMPAGVAVDPAGRLYVADAYNRRVQVFDLLDAAGGETP